MEPQTKGAPGEIMPPSIFEARCLSLEKIVVVAVESYNIAMMALYIRLSKYCYSNQLLKLTTFFKQTKNRFSE